MITAWLETSYICPSCDRTFGVSAVRTTAPCDAVAACPFCGFQTSAALPGGAQRALTCPSCEAFRLHGEESCRLCSTPSLSPVPEHADFWGAEIAEAFRRAQDRTHAWRHHLTPDPLTVLAWSRNLGRSLRGRRATVEENDENRVAVWLEQLADRAGADAADDPLLAFAWCYLRFQEQEGFLHQGLADSLFDHVAERADGLRTAAGGDELRSRAGEASLLRRLVSRVTRGGLREAWWRWTTLGRRSRTSRLVRTLDGELYTLLIRTRGDLPTMGTGQILLDAETARADFSYLAAATGEPFVVTLLRGDRAPRELLWVVRALPARISA